jgi:two-component system phosphate regulon response regulator PhoB
MERIVLAEDDPTMVRLLATLLTMDGFEVTALDPEEDVVAAVGREQPDLLILDFLLANQSGLDVLDAIRRSEGEDKLRVVMISGLNVRDECLRHGADDFLLKPFMPDDLIRVLRNRSHSP